MVPFFLLLLRTGNGIANINVISLAHITYSVSLILMTWNSAQILQWHYTEKRTDDRLKDRKRGEKAWNEMKSNEKKKTNFGLKIGKLLTFSNKSRSEWFFCMLSLNGYEFVCVSVVIVRHIHFPDRFSVRFSFSALYLCILLDSPNKIFASSTLRINATFA